MSEVVAGIQRCGCITFFLSRDDHVRRADERTMGKIIRNGGRIEHVEMDELNKNPDFMPFECPHDPKGWEPSVPRKVSCIICGVSRHPGNMVNVYEGEYQCQECRWGL